MSLNSNSVLSVLFRVYDFSTRVAVIDQSAWFPTPPRKTTTFSCDASSLPPLIGLLGEISSSGLRTRALQCEHVNARPDDRRVERSWEEASSLAADP